MIIYPVREGLNFILTYIRRDTLCKSCGKNEAWVRQRLNRSKRNLGKNFYYFSQQDCDTINKSLPKLADDLELTIRIPSVHTPDNATTVRGEIESLINIIRVQNLQKDFGYDKARWHDRISDTDMRYFFKPEELRYMRETIKKVASILRNVQVEYEDI